MLKTKEGRAAGSAVVIVGVRKRVWRTCKGETKVGWVVDYVDEQGHRARRQFETKRQADAYRVEAEGQLRAGTYRADGDRMTVEAAAEHFLTYCRSRMERRERMTRGTFEVYTGHVHNYICPAAGRSARTLQNVCIFEAGLAPMKLRQLTGRAVSDFRDRLRVAGLSVAMTRKVLGTLRLILSYAIGRDLIAVNVAQGVRVIGRRDEGSKVIVAPSKDAVRQLLAAADPYFRVVLLFAAMTGLRAGEMHALRWRHLDLETGEVRIETRVDEFGEEDITKTAAGMRTVPLGVGMVAALRDWQARTAHTKPSDLVFPGRNGGYQNHGSLVRKRFYPLFVAMADRHEADPSNCSEPPARFNWHALRHFAVSCWIEAGLNPKTVQTFAGHSSLEMTMDRYGHLFKSENHRLAMDVISTSAWLPASA